MCGINGIFAYGEQAPPVDEGELLRTREHMRARGPDGAGLWCSDDRRVGLAHRRLAIIDLSEAGAQPMCSADGRLVVSLNGEIYNYRALRLELEAKGTRFRTQSDTEVLLHLYAERGAKMLEALRGMFAFALWDNAEQSLFLARDPFGIKPLYFSDRHGTLRFASQVKALLAGGAVDDAPEPAGSTGFLLWGAVPEPFTLYRDIVALPAGANLTVTRSGRPRQARYFSVRDVLMEAQREERAFCAEDRLPLAEALRDTVRHHLVADVPVGMFLSAGVDSSMIASVAGQASGVSLRTLTLGFREYEGGPRDEVPAAERMAAALGSRHETRWIRGEDFADEQAALLAAMDQPTTDGVNTYLVCREAARSGLRVALSGIGGDELFGGYPSFRQVPWMARLLAPLALLPGFGQCTRWLATRLMPAGFSPKLAGILEYGGRLEGAYLLRRALYMPWEIGRVLDPTTVHVGLERLSSGAALVQAIHGLRRGHARVAALELAWYMRNQLLRDADWAGMAHSVEVRVPLVDAVLFRTLAPWIVSGRPPTKTDAAEALETPLRGELLSRPKSGFSVPVREWTRERKDRGARGLRDWARRVLPEFPRQLRILALVGDAYGGRGGIAKFNRDLLSAMAAMPECAEIVVVSRWIPDDPGVLPERVRLDRQSVMGRPAFMRAAVRAAAAGPLDLVVAAHINFAALASIIAAARNAPALLVVHGIDAWYRHRSAMVRQGVARMDAVAGVSRLTLERFKAWSGVPDEKLRLLPNCVDLQAFRPGQRPADLESAYGLAGRKVLMTLGRLASSERYKGVDEMLEALPELCERIPELAYVVAGDGDDRARLLAKAAALGVSERVVFSGYVPEERKADFYRLADAYVMPSRGEGFGITFLEALACGTPVMGSRVDGGREALLDGELGELVDPALPDDVREGTLRTLRRPREVPRGLHGFSAEAFTERAHRLVREAVFGRQGGGTAARESAQQREQRRTHAGH